VVDAGKNLGAVFIRERDPGRGHAHELRIYRKAGVRGRSKNPFGALYAYLRRRGIRARRRCVVTRREGRHVVLVGLMGSGKSTVGHALARRLGRPFVDNDEALEARSGRSARAIADADGADALHRLEAQALVDALARPEPAVVAMAASVVEHPGTADALR